MKHILAFVALLFLPGSLAEAGHGGDADRRAEGKFQFPDKVPAEHPGISERMVLKTDFPDGTDNTKVYKRVIPSDWMVRGWFFQNGKKILTGTGDSFEPSCYVQLYFRKDMQNILLPFPKTIFITHLNGEMRNGSKLGAFTQEIADWEVADGAFPEGAKARSVLQVQFGNEDGPYYGIIQCSRLSRSKAAAPIDWDMVQKAFGSTLAKP